MKFVILIFAALLLCAYALNVNDEYSAMLMLNEGIDFETVNASPYAQDWDPYTEITFNLFTRSNPNDSIQVFVGNLNNSTYDANKPSMFILHGYNSNAFTRGNIAMKDAFLRVLDCNVFNVDWSGPGGGVLYNVCRNNTKPTGQYIGQFYLYLESVGASLSSMHCTGHSLGAHVCGYSGKAVNGLLGRISGLDPALPLFDLEVPEERLAVTDAQYVDVIHTAGGGLGFFDPIGHADFYPNNGTAVQPGCAPDLSGSCSHGRSHDYFVESIESPNFVARLCTSYEEYQAGICSANEAQLMGYPSSSSSRGWYYLNTASESPFALG